MNAWYWHPCCDQTFGAEAPFALRSLRRDLPATPGLHEPCPTEWASGGGNCRAFARHSVQHLRAQKEQASVGFPSPTGEGMLVLASEPVGARRRAGLATSGQQAIDTLDEPNGQPDAQRGIPMGGA
jgi:hypothetical protein